MWPQWSKIYGGVVATPMMLVSIGIAGWIIITNFGGALDNISPSSALLMVGVFAVAFCFTAWLFYMGVSRLFTDQVEALLFAATGHLMMAIPAMVFTIIGFISNQNQYLSDLEEIVEEGAIGPEFLLIVWMIVHSYLALMLAMADNTSPVEQSGNRSVTS